MWFAFVLLMISSNVSCKNNTFSMPGVRPSYEDQYLCTSFKRADKASYITQFSAHGHGGNAHHMILFGCSDISHKYLYPNYWDCGRGFICNGQMSIKFAWAKNAKPTSLPKNVGFEIGTDRSKVKYLILQVHYARTLKRGQKNDTSGLTLNISKRKPAYLAGIYLLLGNEGLIPAHAPVTHIDVNCLVRGSSPMYMFAFRTHAHDLGTVITGYRYRKENRRWDLIAKGNPQWPQAFYPMDKVYEAKPKDYLTARCTYNATNRNVDTNIGMTHKDEMCNLYIMFYTNSTNFDDTYKECDEIENPQLVDNLPPGNDVPLPPNRDLEQQAHGQEHMKTTKKNEEAKDKAHSSHGYVEQPFKLNLGNMKLGQVTAATLDGKGNLFVFHRGDHVWDGNSFDAYDRYRWRNNGAIKEKTILQIDVEKSTIVNSFGSEMFYMPHGLTVDKHGNLWVTDVALHQVKKYSLKDNKLTEMLSLGEKFKPGSDSNHFCKPTSVAVMQNGTFFVADGYCNSRIMKFKSDGSLITQFGYATPFNLFGGKIPDDSFNLPHKITLIEKKGLLCVADRLNGRIVCYSLSNNMFHNKISSEKFGGVMFSIDYADVDGGLIFAVNGQNYLKTVQGFVMPLKVNGENDIASFGPRGGKTLQTPHDIAVSNDGSYVFVVEIHPNKIWKFQKVGSKLPVKIQETISTTTQTKLINKNHGIVNSTKSGSVLTTQFNTTILVLALLAVPTLILIITSVICQMKKRGMLTSKKSKEKFSVGNFLNRHKGFDRISTQEDDIDAIESSDSEVEEFSVNRTKA